MKSFRRWLVENKDWSDLDLKQYNNSEKDISGVDLEEDIVQQEVLVEIYDECPKKEMYIKNTPVALVPCSELKSIFGENGASEIFKLAGSVDNTDYSKTSVGQKYQESGYMVFQWANNKLDIYIANPDVLNSKYSEFNGQLPTDEESRSKIPSLVALEYVKKLIKIPSLDFSKIPFYIKKVPTEMVKVENIVYPPSSKYGDLGVKGGLGGKKIEVSWGKQTVHPKGFLVKEKEKGNHVYTVAPDEKGLPIGYVPY